MVLSQEIIFLLSHYEALLRKLDSLKATAVTLNSSRVYEEAAPSLRPQRDQTSRRELRLGAEF